MSTFDAFLRIEDTDEAPLSVVIDLTEDERVVVHAGEVEIGDWARDQMRLTARDDGFHLLVEGEEMVLDVRDDARFALELGMRNAPPLLRRRMAALLRGDADS